MYLKFPARIGLHSYLLGDAKYYTPKIFESLYTVAGTTIMNFVKSVFAVFGRISLHFLFNPIQGWVLVAKANQKFWKYNSISHHLEGIKNAVRCWVIDNLTYDARGGNFIAT